MCILPNFSAQDLELRKQKKKLITKKVDDKTEKVVIELALVENLIQLGSCELKISYFFRFINYKDLQ